MRKTILTLAVFFAIAVASLAGAPEDDAAKYRADLDEGISLLRSGTRDDIHRSIAKFKSALKVLPESAEAYYWLALAYSDLNNYLRAADNAKDATTYDDRLAEAWLLWGQILLYQKDWNNARVKLETAAYLAPEDPVAQYNLGRVYYHGLKDPDAALAKFRTAWQNGQKLRRDNPEMIALTLRSRLYMGCCEYDRGVRSDNPVYFENAVNAFQDVLREQPNNYDAHLRLAFALRKIGRASESQAMLRHILEEGQSGAITDKQILAESNLQLADIYLKLPQLENNRMEAVLLLREFISLVGNSSHPALEPAREYVSTYDDPEMVRM